MSALGRPTKADCNAYFLGYTDKVQADDVLAALEAQGRELDELLAGLDETRGNHRYAPGKWSVKGVVGHLVDCERVFQYRALSAARGDRTPLPGFDQDVWMAGVDFDRRTLGELRAELSGVRSASLTLFRSLTDEAWSRGAQAEGKDYTVRAVPWIMAGHERHHGAVLRERYL